MANDPLITLQPKTDEGMQLTLSKYPLKASGIRAPWIQDIWSSPFVDPAQSKVGEKVQI